MYFPSIFAYTYLFLPSSSRNGQTVGPHSLYVSQMLFNPDTASKATYVDKAYRGWNKTIRNWDAAAKLIMTPCLSLPASFWFVIRFDSPRSCVTPTAPTHRIADNIFRFVLTPIIYLLMGSIIGQQRHVRDLPPFPVEFLHLTGP